MSMTSVQLNRPRASANRALMPNGQQAKVTQPRDHLGGAVHPSRGPAHCSGPVGQMALRLPGHLPLRFTAWLFTPGQLCRKTGSVICAGNRGLWGTPERTPTC